MTPIPLRWVVLVMLVAPLISQTAGGAGEWNRLESIAETVRRVVRSPDVPMELLEVPEEVADSEGEWDISVPWTGLVDEYRKMATDAGYGETDDVVLRVGADGIQARPKSYKFDVQVEEMVLPDEGSGGYVRMRADIARIPPFLREEAIRKGYEESELVRIELRVSNESGRAYEVLPPLFILGFSEDFDALTRREQKDVEPLGYRSGDLVWKTIDEKGFLPISKIRAGEGPMFRIVGARRVDLPNGNVDLVPSCVVRFDDLSNEWKEKARSLGYGNGDEVGFEWSTSRGEPRMVKAEAILRNFE